MWTAANERNRGCSWHSFRIRTFGAKHASMISAYGWFLFSSYLVQHFSYYSGDDLMHECSIYPNVDCETAKSGGTGPGKASNPIAILKDYHIPWPDKFSSQGTCPADIRTLSHLLELFIM